MLLRASTGFSLEKVKIISIIIKIGANSLEDMLILNLFYEVNIEIPKDFYIIVTMAQKYSRVACLMRQLHKSWPSPASIRHNLTQSPVT